MLYYNGCISKIGSEQFVRPELPPGKVVASVLRGQNGQSVKAKTARSHHSMYRTTVLLTGVPFYSMLSIDPIALP